MRKVSIDGDGYVDEAHIVDLVQVGLMSTKNVIARGETGTGKTYLFHWLCGRASEQPSPNQAPPDYAVELWEPYELNVPQLSKFSCHEEQGYVDIVAQDILADGETKAKKQILLQWLEPTVDDKTPKLLLVDEANFLSPSVAGFFHSLCDWQAGIWVPELNEFVRRSPLHWLALCINPFEKAIYQGTKQMNSALAGRFLTIDIGYMSKSSEIKFLKARFPNADKQLIDRLCEFAGNTRVAYRQDLLNVPATPRNLVQWFDIMEKGKFSLTDIEPVVLGVWSPDQQKAVKGLLEGQEIGKVFKSVGVDQ